jgi:molybdopterin-guanine dinucleotide biosynthesis protein
MPFTIISVTGAHSKVGKTTLCSILLNNLRGYGAIKFTKTPLYTSVTDDPDIILQEGKDTAIMSRAGADKVVWIQSGGSELEDALHIAMNRMEGLKGVVVEGNSPVNFLNPDLIIFIVGDDGHIKPSARDVGEKADIIVINSPNKREDPSFPDFLPQNNAQIFRIDLIKKEGEIDKFLAYTEQYTKA